MIGDLNGLSDGYVKFRTSETGKQKTKIFKPSLNPDWVRKKGSPYSCQKGSPNIIMKETLT